MKLILSILMTFGLWSPQTPIHNPSPETTTSVIAVSAHQPSPQKPVQINIPNINLSAVVLEAGLNEKNLMWVPDDEFSTSWWKYGARPGDRGNAVLAGHYTVENGRPGVFNKLDKVKIGDTVSVADTDGNNWDYQVSSLDNYTVEEFPTSQVYGDSQEYQLILITCSGKFISALKDYSHRLVVSGKMIKTHE
jgi:sortase A